MKLSNRSSSFSPARRLGALAVIVVAACLFRAYSSDGSARSHADKLKAAHALAVEYGSASAAGGLQSLQNVFPAFDGSKKQCDVLVVGGTPAGIAAALAAARRGADVVLIEGRPLLGGDIVYAMLNQFDVPARPGEASPVHGIFAEFYDRLGTAFDIAKSCRLFDDTVGIEPTLHTYTRTHVVRILKDGDRVVGAVLKGAATPGHPAPQEAELKARVVIDATNDASFAVRAGTGYYLGRENANRDKAMQSAGLLFSLTGVNWHALKKYVQGSRLMKAKPGAAPLKKQVWLRLGGINGNYIWERGDMVRGYKPHGKDIMVLSINFGNQGDGTVVLNSLNIVGVNGLEPSSTRAARNEAVAELPWLISFLRGKYPQIFKNARLKRAAPELYIRETRHIHGYYDLKVSDIRGQQRFYDRIAMASYPLDLHPYKLGDINPFGARRYFYTIPIRCLTPREVDGVFVASRSISATYSAAGSARVIPITMSAGEAAGAAAWHCVRHNETPHQLIRDVRSLRDIQNSLRDWGADIGDRYPGQSLASPLRMARLNVHRGPAKSKSPNSAALATLRSAHSE